MSRKASQPKAAPQVTYSYFNPLAAIRQILYNTENILSEIEDLQAGVADLSQAQTDEAARQQAEDQAEQAREQALSDQITQLDQHVADLEAQLAAGGLTDEQKAALVAATATVKQVADNLRAEQAA